MIKFQTTFQWNKWPGFSIRLMPEVWKRRRWDSMEYHKAFIFEFVILWLEASFKIWSRNEVRKN